MSWRGVVVALLCGLFGLGGGALAAYAVQPHTSDAGSPRPLAAVSPSVPIDVTPSRSYAPDISYGTLAPDLPLPPPDHHMHNDLATWTYHVPQGWTAYGVCAAPPTGPPCKIATDEKVPPHKVDKQTQVRFRPPDEPLIGGYSLRVKILDNTDLNPAQMVATKNVGFEQEFSHQNFRVTKRTPSAVYFSYVDSTNHLRLNYFQWFAVEGSANATLEMSVSGRVSDKAGLQALMMRFADNLSGSSP
jgi:hypothetical protein